MRRLPASLFMALAPRPRYAGDQHWPREWWNDDVESGTVWQIIDGTGTPILATGAAYAHAGSNGLGATTEPTFPAPDDYLTAQALSTPPAQDYWTFSLWLRLPVKARAARVAFHLNHYAGGHRYQALLSHLTAADKWQYWTSAGAWADVAGGAYVWPDNTWVHAQLQIRLSTTRWGTITWPGGSADLSAQSLYDAGVEAGSAAQLEIHCVTSGALALTLHADDFQLFHSPSP